MRDLLNFACYFISIIASVNLLNYTVEGPYKSFFNLDTLFLPKPILRRSDVSMLISSSRFPCKNSFFASNCYKTQLNVVTKDNKILTIFIVVIGANVS